jgi:hypothetical protein
MKHLLLFSFVLLFVINVNGQKKRVNPYQTEGTKEYEEVTSKLIGEWNILSFSSKKNEKIGVIYESATVEFKKFNENGGGGVAIFRFVLPRSIIDGRIAVWKKDTTIIVDSYVVVANVEFKIHKKGVLVYLDNQVNYPEIKGSGDRFENFQEMEIGFITSQSSMKNKGGVKNLLGAKLMKVVSGTDFIPKIPSQVNYKNLTDTSVNLIALRKVKFKLTK